MSWEVSDRLMEIRFVVLIDWKSGLVDWLIGRWFDEPVK
jgi:hypothetical protein